MDVQELLQLAQGNSSIAKKKSEKLSKNVDGKNNNVASSAVALYLAKKKKEKDAQIAAEEEARRKRIQARVSANIVEKKTNKNNAVEKKPLPEKMKVKSETPKPTKGDIKFKVHESHKRKNDKQHQQQVSKSKYRKTVDSEVKHGKRHEHKKTQPDFKNKGKPHKESRHDNEHRKEKERTDFNDKKIKHKQKAKKSSSANGSGLSFTDILKLAKCNSENPGSGKIVQNDILKRSAPTEHTFDPDRSIKVRRKQRPAAPSLSPPPERSKPKVGKLDRRDHHQSQSKDKVKKYSEHRHSEQQKIKQQLKQQQQQQNKPRFQDQQQRKSKSQDPKYHKIRPAKTTEIRSTKENKPVQRGLVVETVSTSKNYVGKNNKNNVQRQRVMMNAKRDSDNRDRGGGRSIAAQTRGGVPSLKQKNNTNKSSKRSANDYEDEFEKEEKMLAKKRKLFEMRRITGNKNLTEDDLLDEDYDIDEEDEEDGDFIDDTEDAGDVSGYIRSIFGYDRRRYEESDEDDPDMESSYAQIEKEEARSARIAKIEDDYERMKEEESEERMRQREPRKK